MEKYISTIKDLVALSMANAIDENDETISNFQRGMIHLLGINTQVNFVRARQFFSNSSLRNDPDANYLLGFVEECEGNYSSSFKYYALAAEKAKEENDSSYFQKVFNGREMLKKTFMKYNLPLTLNNQITKILNDINKGTGKTKLNSEIIAAFICEDELSCIEVAQELFDAGDLYSAKLLLRKGNIDSSCALYDKIDKLVLESIDKIDKIKGGIIKLESESFLPNYDKSLSIDQLKKECDNDSMSCCREWTEINKTNIGKMVKSQKRRISNEKAKKQEKYEAIGWWLVLPVIIFGIGCILGYHWDFNAFWLGVGCAVFYYCVAIYVKLS